MRCGLLGRKLGHSYSPQIHAQLASYSYELFEKEPEELEDFLKNGDFSALNVTIPYKQAVIPYLDELSPLAKRLGSVNTIVRRSGRLIGHNTDYFGFFSTVSRSGLDLRGKKCLIIGTGGVSKPAIAVLSELGAVVIPISHRENTPENLAQHADASLIVNCTPVGMYPNVGQSPVDLAQFPALEGVIDMIFNPARTELLMQAEKRGIVAIGGLWMLVAQAKEASEWFQDATISDSEIARIYALLRAQTENIILIGMPGCGKTTIGQILATRTNRRFVDADAYIETLAGKSIPQIFAEDGEAIFRDWETKALASLGAQSALILATGGGCVTQACNYPLLHQNGRIVYIKRDLSLLPTDGRPLSQRTRLSDMYAVRAPLYEAFADLTIDNCTTPAQAAEQILEAIP